MVSELKHCHFNLLGEQRYQIYIFLRFKRICFVLIVNTIETIQKKKKVELCIDETSQYHSLLFNNHYFF